MPTKKGFDGKNKKSDTYDADWVFVKNKHTKGPNHSAGAWMTKKQAKKLRQENKPKGPAPAAAPAAPAAPGTVPIPVPGTPPATVPIAGVPSGPWGSPVPGGVPGKAGGPIPTLPVPGAGGLPGRKSTPAAAATPTWWIAQAYKNPTDETQTFANIANALLPSLAPEDQRTLAMYLAQNNKDVYGGYADVNFGMAPTEITDKLRNQYLSPQRAQQALNLLEKMKTASGATNMGAGYDYLKNAIGLINQFSTGGPMTREAYQQFSNAVANLSKNASGALAPYGNLAQLFNLPSFSAGPLVSNAPNNKLFG